MIAIIRDQKTHWSAIKAGLSLPEKVTRLFAGMAVRQSESLPSLSTWLSSTK